MEMSKAMAKQTGPRDLVSLTGKFLIFCVDKSRVFFRNFVRAPITYFERLGVAGFLFARDVLNQVLRASQRAIVSIELGTCENGDQALAAMLRALLHSKLRRENPVDLVILVPAHLAHLEQEVTSIALLSESTMNVHLYREHKDIDSFGLHWAGKIESNPQNQLFGSESERGAGAGLRVPRYFASRSRNLLKALGLRAKFVLWLGEEGADGFRRAEKFLAEHEGWKVIFMPVGNSARFSQALPASLIWLPDLALNTLDILGLIECVDQVVVDSGGGSELLFAQYAKIFGKIRLQ